MTKTDNQLGKPAPSELSKHDAPQELPFDPSRFGAIEIPLELRARLLNAKLPRVPREQLEDTVPPRASDKRALDGASALLPAPQRRAMLRASRTLWIVVAV